MQFKHTYGIGSFEILKWIEIGRINTIKDFNPKFWTRNETTNNSKGAERNKKLLVKAACIGLHFNYA
jgi:hypothetical protein